MSICHRGVSVYKLWVLHMNMFLLQVARVPPLYSIKAAEIYHVFVAFDMIRGP